LLKVKKKQYTMTIVDKLMPDMDPDKLKKGAKTADAYYRGFVKMSGYSWAIAIATAGVAYAGWKMFGPKDTHDHHFPQHPPHQSPSPSPPQSQTDQNTKH